jgi:hypothetical protein
MSFRGFRSPGVLPIGGGQSPTLLGARLAQMRKPEGNHLAHLWLCSRFVYAKGNDREKWDPRLVLMRLDQ